jgi:low affinity Fe/Cu permease
MLTKKSTTYFHKLFGTLSEGAAVKTGSPLAFIFALLFVITCTVMGPILHYSQTWEMVVTIIPTIITFLLVFLIQNSQTRETLAVQLKLNELIRATQGAHMTMVNLEKLTQEELVVLCGQFGLLAEEARGNVSRGETDQGAPEMPLAASL